MKGQQRTTEGLGQASAPAGLFNDSHTLLNQPNSGLCKQIFHSSGHFIIHSHTLSFIHSFIHPFIHSFIHLPIHLFLHTSVYLLFRDQCLIVLSIFYILFMQTQFSHILIKTFQFIIILFLYLILTYSLPVI